MDQLLITRIVEAALMASTQPLTPAQLEGLFPEDEPAPPGSIARALELLRDGCAERGVELVEVASGFRFQVKADVHPWVARLWTERRTRYTRATLETLALIAYRQPITRGEIEQVRGVAVSSNIIQALEEREWIRVVGHRDVPGKPALFGTTKVFLDYFGLKRLDELPPLSELKDIAELDPQLRLDKDEAPPATMTASAAMPDADTADTEAAGTLDAGGRDAEGDADSQAGSDVKVPADTAGDTAEDAPSAEDTDAGTEPDVPAVREDGPEAAPEQSAADTPNEDNAVVKTTVAVDQADPEPEADETVAGRSQTHE